MGGRPPGVLDVSVGYLPVVELTRDGIVESVHMGAVVVVDIDSHVIAAYGDPGTVTFMRSSAKPFQALSLIESGTALAFGFTPREVALACGSHAGLEMHVDTLSGMHRKAGLRKEDLLCGMHPPIDEDVFDHLRPGHVEPTPAHHNCSGKHTAMLAQARHCGLSTFDYVSSSHPVQQAILADVAFVSGLKSEDVVVGIDGCSAPNYAMPLKNAALAFARLADPSALPRKYAVALRAVFAAMTAHPEMVHGPGGFDTELMRVYSGGVAAKSGAEGYQGLAIAPGLLGPDSPALGIALKIADGARRAVAPVALKVLQQLGVLDETRLNVLRARGYTSRGPLENWRRLLVGEIRTCFELSRVA